MRNRVVTLPTTASVWRRGRQTRDRRSPHAICPVQAYPHGFTLIEMLLVLGIIVVFVAMTTPSVLRMYRQRKLTESAEHVRALAASARIRAIETGLVYQFCCETNGTHFIVVPFEPDHLNGSNAGQGGTPGVLASRAFGNLPKGILLNTGFPGVTAIPGVAAMGNKLAPTALDGLPNSGDLANLNWSTPILFNPDGAANADTEITVSDAKSQQIKIKVRAFTGAVTMERLSAGKR